MNIWFICTEYPPDYGGGISTYVNQSAQTLSLLGHNVTIFTRGHDKDSISKENNRLTIIRFKQEGDPIFGILGYWTALSYQFMKKISWYLNNFSERPDIIEAQDYNAPAYYLLQNKLNDSTFLKNIPIVTYLHTPSFEIDKVNQTPKYKMPNFLIGSMEKFSILASNNVLSPSAFLENIITKQFPKIRISKIVYPLQGMNKINLWSKRSIKLNSYLYVGRLEYRKGVIQLLEQFSLLWNAGSHLKLTLIGGDTHFYPKNTSLKKWIESKYKCEIDSNLLELKDSMPPDKLKLIIVNYKALIVPSLYENFPYVSMVGMSLGIPLIVSKQGGQAEMIGKNNSCGLVFDWNIKNDLSNKIIEFEGFDNKKILSISKNAHHRGLKLFDPIIVTKQKIIEYERIINNYQVHASYPFVSNTKQLRPIANISKYSNFQHGLLSIIIPYFNMGDYILDCIKSALNSSYEKKEIIIVNDGSTDKDSINKLELISQKNLRSIKIINTSNQGLALARNTGAENARGEFLAFLDADNMIDPTFYKKAISILSNYQNVSYVYSWLEYFGNTKGTWPTFNTELPLLLVINMLDALSVIRKNVFLSFGKNRSEMIYGMEDYDSWISLAEAGHFGVSIPEPLLKYRVRTNSMSRNFNEANILRSIEMISVNHTALYRKYGVETFNLLQSNGPSYLWNNPSGTYPKLAYTNNSISETGIPSEHKQLFNQLYHSKIGQIGLRTFYKLRIQKILKAFNLI